MIGEYKIPSLHWEDAGDASSTVAQIGSQIFMTAAASGTASIDVWLPLDLTKYHVGWVVEIDDKTNLSQVDSTIHMDQERARFVTPIHYSDWNLTVSKRHEMPVLPSTNSTAQKDSGDDPTYLDLDKSERYTLTLKASAGGACSMRVTGLKVTRRIDGIIWEFDDGNSSTMDVALPILRANGFGASIPITRQYFDNPGTDYLTVAEIQALEASGDVEFTNHASTGTMAGFTAQQVRESVCGNLSRMLELGLNEESANHLILPGGGTSDTVKGVVRGLCTTTRQVTSERVHGAHIYKDRTAMSTNYVSSNWTAAQMETNLSPYPDFGGVCRVTAHNVVPDGEVSGIDWGVTNFTECVEWAASVGFQNRMLREVF